MAESEFLHPASSEINTIDTMCIGFFWRGLYTAKLAMVFAIPLTECPPQLFPLTFPWQRPAKDKVGDHGLKAVRMGTMVAASLLIARLTVWRTCVCSGSFLFCRYFWHWLLLLLLFCCNCQSFFHFLFNIHVTKSNKWQFIYGHYYVSCNPDKTKFPGILWNHRCADNPLC